MEPGILPETPLPSTSREEVWGSDAIARMLQALELPYVALNPGASFRGLHDSLVNYAGNRQPQMLLCLHEESAVAIAHGYAKVTGRMMGVVLHSNRTVVGKPNAFALPFSVALVSPRSLAGRVVTIR